MSNQNNIITQISGLDFESIKNNLKAYYQNQEEFKDYNFDGSNLNQLLNILAYNTHYDAFSLNMQSSEMTLQNTTKRISTVDRAKQIGYVPRSTRSSSSFLTLELFPTNPLSDTLLIPSGYSFQTEILGQAFVFSTLIDYVAIKDGDDRFILENVEVVEGRRFTHRFTITQDTLSGVIIPNRNVDTTRLRVTVKPSATSTDQVVYQPVKNIVDVESDSTVYFLDEVEGQRYRVYFGDGVVGQNIEIGNQVIIDYIVSAGAASNLASVFEPASEIADVDEISIISTTPASGGSDIESIESIKVSAPLAFQSQNRAVSYADYFPSVREVFSDIDALSVWGGEDNDPVALGYVFISIKPTGRAFLTETEKIDIETELKKRYSIVAIEPVIVDPDYLYIRVNSIVKYVNGSNVTGLIDAIRNSITTYSDQELKSFNEILRYSKLTRFIDQSSSVITNNLTHIEIISEKRLEVGNQVEFALNFTQNIKPEIFRSEFFFAQVGVSNFENAYYVGRTDSTIDLVRELNGVEVTIQEEVGEIFDNGVVKLTNYLGSDSGELNKIVKFFATPLVLDVTPQRNTIIEIRPQDIFVTLSPN